MHQKLTNCLLFVGAVLASTARLAAQTSEVRNLATDTLQPENASYYHAVSQIGTMGGKRLYVFLDNFGVAPNLLEFTWRNPMTLPRPKLVRIKTEQIKWVRTEGVVYEPVRASGQETGVLAMRVSNGPRLALFDVATLKKGIPIPLAGGGFIWTRAFSSSYNHAWYVRYPGETVMRAVPKGRDFAPFAAALLGDASELAVAIQAKAEGHQHDDMPQLIDRYNKLMATIPVAR